MHESFVEFLDVVSPRLGCAIEMRLASASRSDWNPDETVQTADCASVVGLVEAAFGNPPSTFTLRPRGSDRQALLTDLLTSSDSPLTLADLLVASGEEDIVVVSPRRDELAAALSSWVGSNDRQRVLSIRASESSGKRMSA
jgi:hypothetical protein